MKRNSKLSLALHALGHMAGDPDRMQTSGEIAAHAGTNPVVVRRVLGRLREAGLLLAEKGHAGGWRLSRAPETITLADIYLALDERLAPEAEHAAPRCSVEHALEGRVATVMEEAEAALVRRLATMTIADAREPAE